MHLKKLHIFKFTKKSDVLPKFWTNTSKIEVSDRISKSLYQQKLRCPGPYGGVCRTAPATPGLLIIEDFRQFTKFREIKRSTL